MKIGERVVRLAGPDGTDWEFVVKADDKNGFTVAHHTLREDLGFHFGAWWDPQSKTIPIVGQKDRGFARAQAIMGSRWSEALTAWSRAVDEIRTITCDVCGRQVPRDITTFAVEGEGLPPGWGFAERYDLEPTFLMTVTCSEPCRALLSRMKHPPNA